jgi:hypothetical protein
MVPFPHCRLVDFDVAGMGGTRNAHHIYLIISGSILLGIRAYFFPLPCLIHHSPPFPDIVVL